MIEPHGRTPRVWTQQERDEYMKTRPHVVRNFTTIEEYGEYIKEEDVVRPLNSRWCYQMGEETATWRQKSEARCPTYGSCLYCVKSGPVGKLCNECNIPEAGYAVMMNGSKHLDSITLARLFGKGHEAARADRVCFQQMQKLHQFYPDCARVCAERMYEDIQDPVEKADMIRVKQIEFQSFLGA
jgi:hypothetical protein